MNVKRAGAKMLLCPSCAQIMRLVRQTQRFGKLPDVCTFECRDCAFRMSRNVSRYVHDLDVHCRMEQRGILRTCSTGRPEVFGAEANWTILVCCIMPLQPVRRRAC